MGTCVRDCTGAPLTRFRRAIESRSILLAELAAREDGRLPLQHAVALVALYARLDDAKFERAAIRWLARRSVVGNQGHHALPPDALGERHWPRPQDVDH